MQSRIFVVSIVGNMFVDHRTNRARSLMICVPSMTFVTNHVVKSRDFDHVTIAAIFMILNSHSYVNTSVNKRKIVAKCLKVQEAHQFPSDTLAQDGICF